MKILVRFGAGLLVIALLCAAAMADDDPPGRVARLQYMSGQVSLQPGGVNDWVEAVNNRPLTTADRLWSDKESRAELNLGAATMRVNAETSLTLTNLTDGTLQVELDQGTLNLRVRRLYHGEIYEVDTPNLAFMVMKAGNYRFDVDPNGDSTLVTVWRGEGEATGEGRSVRVKGDRRARFTGGASLEHEISDDPERDGFDDWCRVRDKRQASLQSARYVSPSVIGAEDLDEYGTWRVVPEYGAMWVPRVDPDWAPYHYGHWAWVEPWGWTWVDDAPWGFAPSHYGRWVHYGGTWAWCPGPVAARPVYAPALVAWVGGGGVSVGVTIGEAPTVGWFPLSYGEPYIPPYRGSRNYFQNVNVSNTRITNITNVTNNYYNNNTTITKNNTTIINNNTTNITNNRTTNNVHIRYANQNVPGAVTAVPGNVMASSQPVAKSAVHVPASEWRKAPVGAAPPVAPSRESVLGERAGRPASMPRGQGISRPVVMRTAAPPKPIPFAAKQEALEHNHGRPLDRDTEKQLRERVARQQSNAPGKMAEKQPVQAERPAGPAAMRNPVSHQPDQRPAMQSEAQPRGHGVQALHNQGPQGDAVPRPPQRNSAPRPNYQPVVSSPRQGEPRIVRQAPANTAPIPRDATQHESGMNEPRRPDHQMTAPRPQSAPDRGPSSPIAAPAPRPTESRPHAEPTHAARPAPHAQSAPSGGGRPAQSPAPSAPPAGHGKDTKDKAHGDNKH